MGDILWWEDDRLVGFAGLYAFGGPTVEVGGMVHPNFRRRGIGGRLLDEARQLCQERGSRKLLLVIPRSSPGGRALAESRGGYLEHSEHALELLGASSEGPSDPSLLLRPATGDDVVEVARILAAVFGDTSPPRNLDYPGESTLVAERNGSIIATLRIHQSAEDWGIYAFGVETQHQGLGIGRDLLRRVCRQAAEAGASRLHLEVEVNNDRALGLYTSLGFTRTSTEDYFEIPL
jgi:ribosomal protein S18 acetylase RimI-like enzyme